MVTASKKTRTGRLQENFTGDASERDQKGFWVQTREEQDVLSDPKDTENIWYDINRNYTDDGYDIISA